MSLAEQKIYYTEADYYNLPDDIQAEIIQGEIYYKAAPNIRHQEISSELHAAIYNNIKAKGNSFKLFHAPIDVKLSDSPTTIIQPDLMVICDKNKLDKNRCNGAPGWIIEIISSSTASYDYITKLNLYFESGVKEYWIVDPVSEKITVFHLEKSKFSTNTYTFEDKIQVGIFDNFYIDFKEIHERLL